MRRLAAILILFLAALQLHSQDYAQLDSLMDVYILAMRPESAEAKMAETDYMIASARDSSTRQHIALRLFDSYKESPLMGEEEVAIHIFDTWFAGGLLPMRSEFDFMDARLFADFNRSSLLGMDAPQVTLRKPCGGTRTVPEKGRTAILWFYDTSCGKCRAESKVLPQALEEAAVIPVDFYAVYCGQSKKEWRQFRRSFKVGGGNVKVIHLWDPEIESGYLRLYGVISTPKMYMVEPEGRIIGRRLEVENLPQMFSLAEIITQSYKQ